MKRRPLSLFVLSLLAGLLAGCGGGGKPAGLPDATAAGAGPAPAAPSAVGQARFTVLWPPSVASAHGQAGPRLIPSASNSIVVTLQLGSGQPLTQTLVRPAPIQLPYPGGLIPQPIPATATFDNLPIGTYTAAAVAHPNSDGTGTAQAQASVPLTIAAGQVTPFSLTLGSTIARVVVTPNPASVIVGQTTGLTAMAYDGSGNVVLTSAFAWTSGDTSKVTVDPVTGQLSGVSPPPVNPAVPVQITATEPESGVSGTSAVTVRVLRIAGTIRGNPTGSPSVLLGGAILTFTRTQPDFPVFSRTATANLDGTYLSPPLEAGIYTVRASATGYSDATRSGVVLNGQSITEDFVLNPPPPVVR